MAATARQPAPESRQKAGLITRRGKVIAVRTARRKPAST
jgi:hypothetical protein